METSELWDRFDLSVEIAPVIDVLNKRRLLVVGAGGLGGDIALRLGGCRIPVLTLVDGDKVAGPNVPHSSVFLPRHAERGKHKVDVVRQALRAKIPGVRVSVKRKFIQECGAEIFERHDLIVCAPDNDQTRLWVNFYAVKYARPAVYVGLGGPHAEWTGYVFHYEPAVSACFACFATGGGQPEPEELSYAPLTTSDGLDESRMRCAGANVPVPMLAPVVGVVSSYAASLALKRLAGIGDVPTYTYLDLKQPRLLTAQVMPAATCPVCGGQEEYDLDSLMSGPASQR